MKKTYTLLMVAVISLASLQTHAQAFDQSTKMLTIGIGGADIFHLPVGYNYYTRFFEPLTAEFYFQGEFAVHKYVGVGFDVMFGGRPSNYGYGYNGVLGYGYGYAYGYRSEFNIAAGAFANFHFYQLIADKIAQKNGKSIHADKLDIYVGLSTGGGVAIHPAVDQFGTNLDGLFYIGPQVGAHYFFKPNIGVNAELGFGKTFINAGITFKLGGKSSKTK